MYPSQITYVIGVIVVICLLIVLVVFFVKLIKKVVSRDGSSDIEFDTLPYNNKSSTPEIDINEIIKVQSNHSKQIHDLQELFAENMHDHMPKCMEMTLKLDESIVELLLQILTYKIKFNNKSGQDKDIKDISDKKKYDTDTLFHSTQARSDIGSTASPLQAPEVLEFIQHYNTQFYAKKKQLAYKWKGEHCDINETNKIIRTSSDPHFIQICINNVQYVVPDLDLITSASFSENQNAKYFKYFFVAFEIDNVTVGRGVLVEPAVIVDDAIYKKGILNTKVEPYN